MGFTIQIRQKQKKRYKFINHKQTDINNRNKEINKKKTKRKAQKTHKSQS